MGRVPEIAHLLPKPLFIVLAVSARQHHVNAHLPRQNVGHCRRVGAVAKHDGFFARQVLTVDL